MKLRHLVPVLLLSLVATLSACAEPSAECTSPNLVCGGTCIDPELDADNCGACGNACSGNFVCSAGVCACPSGKTDCDGRCVDLRTDSLHCGECSNACGAGNACQGGSCGCANDDCVCPVDECDGVCTDTSTDALNCGGCGIECGAGQHCVASVCAMGDLFAACFQSGQVVPFLKESGQRSGTVADMMAGPQSMALLGDRHLVTVGTLDDTLYVIDRTTMKTVGSLHLSAEAAPNHVLVRDGRAIVVNSNVNSVQIVDVSDPSKPKTLYEVPTGEGTLPSMAAFDEAGTLWVSLNVSNQLISIELGEAAGVAGDPIDLERGAGANPFPAGVAVADRVVYVTLNDLDDKWTPAGNGVLATYAIESKETGLVDLGSDCNNAGAIVAQGRRLYVACTGDYSNGTVAIYDVEDETLEIVETGGGPSRISADPSRPGHFFLADAAGKNVIAVDDRKEVRTIPACTDPNGPAYEFVSDVLVAP